MLVKDELVTLKAELEQLRAIQHNQQQSIEDRLNHFSEKLEKLSQLAITDETISSVRASDDKAHSHAESQTLVSTDDLAKVEALADSKRSEQPQRVDSWRANESSTILQLDNKQQAKNEGVEQVVSQSLTQLASLILGPFTSVFSQIKSFYQHYQAKGLGPVFLMTIAGIITLTLGFAYLLQYSFNNWFSEFTKAIFGFVIANGILILAFIVRDKRPGMEDFSSGLVGLALILNYLSSYFIGPYFQLLPNSLSFLLLLVITLMGFFISIKLETKVVSIIALVGGSLAPLMLISTESAPLLYIPYLILIGCCALVQSRLLKWPLLMEVATLLHIVCIETFTLYLDLPLRGFEWQGLLALLAINSLFYIYGLSAIVWLIKDKNSDSDDVKDTKEEPLLSKRILALPFALNAFLLLMINQFSAFSGEIFLVNGIICATLFYVFKDDKQLRALMLVFAGIFVGFAALHLISNDVLGLVFLLEGLLLLWLGAKEAYISVRVEAYVLLATGLLVNTFGFVDALTLGGYSLTEIDQYGFILIILLLSAASLYAASTLMSKLLFTAPTPCVMGIEVTLFKVIKELLSLGYVVNLLFIAYLLTSSYFLNITPLISLLLLYLAARDKLKFSEILAWLLLLPLLGLIVLGYVEAGGGSFSDQPLYAQLARGEVFISLLLSYYWYRHYFADSKIIKTSYYLQLVCLLILPLLFLPKVVRNFEQYISLAVWASCFISLFLARLVRHRALILEAKIISVLAMFITALSCLLELWQGLAALVIGAIFIATLAYRYLQMTRLSRLVSRLQWQSAPFYFALVVAVTTQTLMGFWQTNWGIVASVLCGYCFWLLSRKPTPIVLRAGYFALYILLFVCAIIPLVMHSQQPLSLDLQSLLYILSEITTLIIVAKLIHNRGLAVRLYKAVLPLNTLRWGWHILLVLSYLLWSYQLDNMLAAPLSAILMVVHASWLMFISLKPAQDKTIRLAAGLFALTCIKVILVDMANFEIVQKVIAFMVIGAILLSVSYFYQKARNQLSQNMTSEDVKDAAVTE